MSLFSNSGPSSPFPPSTVVASNPHPETPLEAADVVRLQGGGDERLVKASRIAFAERRGDYTCILAAGGKPVMTNSTLSQWEARLPGELFSRISRRLLINGTQIQQVSRLDRERTQVFFKDIAEPLTLSRLEFQRLSNLL
jgi:DNA-binding LytR/AlgR family response regulator